MTNNTIAYNVYLISSTTLKKRSLVTDPTLDYLCKPAIECAQKIGLRGIIGDCLLEKLQYLVSTKDEETGNMLINLDEYSNYRILLLRYVTDYLCYSCMSYIVINAREKIRNAGVVNTSDNNYQQPTFNEITYTKRYFDDLSQYYATRLREYIEKNTSIFPEYNACDSCGDKNGKLSNTYHCSIVL